jgi:hypothetical protein
MSTVFLLITFLPIIGAAIAGIGGTDVLKRISRGNGHERAAAGARARGWRRTRA